MKVILVSSKYVLHRISVLNRKSTLTAFFGIVILTFSVYIVLSYELLSPTKKYSGGKETQLHSSRHKINSGPCIIPKLNPFNEAIKKFMLPPQHIDCTAKNHPLIFTTDLDSNLIVVQDPKEFGYEDCCYTPFTRDGGDHHEVYSVYCYAIRANKIKVPAPREFVAVYCRQPKSNSYFMDLFNWLFNKRTLVDMLHFVHLKPAVETRLNSFHTHSRPRAETAEMEANRTPNILILGLDSVSRMNFIRMMPKSYAYLRKNMSAIGMNGYGMFAENTFANMVPMLTGLTREELKRVCWPSSSDYFDSCPFIWKNFSRQGYRTSYAEDSTSMGIFLYEKQGFKEQPTDYYLIPLLDAMDSKIFGLCHEGNSSIRTGLCYGPRLGTTILLNNIQKVLYTLGDSRKYFQFTWVTSLAHENHNLASAGDETLAEFLQWMKEGNYLKNTIFVLMSDHGARFGPFRETKQGSLESRMPFLYFVFPEWFSRKYEVAVSNVRLNQDKLTTPLDLHEMLKDLLDLRSIENEQILKRDLEIKNSTIIPRSISLFLQVPDTSKRKCQDAGIDLHYCACSPPASIAANHTKVLAGADGAVKIINSKLVEYSGCAQLSLDYVINAYAIYNSTSDTNQMTPVHHQSPSISKSYDTNTNATLVMMITFKTSPNDAIFEGTLIESANQWTASGEISRINKYGSQSRCISDYRVKMYCYCL